MIRSKSRLSASVDRLGGIAGDLDLERPLQRLADAARSSSRGRRRRGCARRSRRLPSKSPAALQPDRLHGGGAKLQLVGHHLQPEQALHPRHQRDVADRLGEEIVGAAFQSLHPVLGLIERCHHDDRNVRGARIGLQRRADLEAGHVRHHHVEEDEVDALRDRRSSSASRPFSAVRTSKYSACSRDSSSRTLAAMSSTTRTREVTGSLLTRRRR